MMKQSSLLIFIITVLLAGCGETSTPKPATPPKDGSGLQMKGSNKDSIEAGGGGQPAKGLAN